MMINHAIAISQVIPDNKKQERDDFRLEKKQQEGIFHFRFSCYMQMMTTLYL